MHDIFFLSSRLNKCIHLLKSLPFHHSIHRSFHISIYLFTEESCIYLCTVHTCKSQPASNARFYRSSLQKDIIKQDTMQESR